MRIGAHESIAGGVSQAFQRAEAHGARALQIFTKNARGWSAPALTDAETEAFRAEARRTGLPVIAHGSYLVNLAGEAPEAREKSLACVTEELTRCERLGIPLLILHPGSHPDEARGLRLIAEGLDEVHRRCPGYTARVCLEMTAGQGSALGWRFEHLEELLSRVADEARLAVCLDTCHLFAAGYDLRTPKGYAAVMDECDRRVGLHRVRAFHLNDCKKPLGCRVDRHEEPGKGAIGLTAFRCLMKDARFVDTIGVLETPFPERYGENIRLLESLCRRK
ncbi:endonuclease IV [Corallococcus coralloides DSM 2259]|uniref:Probable endonuclease 4 n=1 Tax=Corallococcus coralloides (strain ATCC 25202 / DSM 2259 / NBRC 100086 / M2) TaxID=1144275 RepID=H8MR92_CORCM|nr:deoxyribonuclease IV [Corallococcus coralloides]AFE09588.1 endonuclease IV [Corallococcus coralloides DSM 2259]